MSLAVYLGTTLNCSIWVTYLFLNALYNFIRGLYWRTNGVHDQLLASRLPENYKTSAHLKKVIYKRVIDGFKMVSEMDFVTVHKRFTHPDCVLRDEWTLYAITPTEAVFVEKGKDWPDHLFNSDFYSLGQFGSAVSVITMPMNQFHRLSEEMEDDGAKLIFIENQARAGGTLLTSIFKKSGRCACMCEPHAYNWLVTYLFSDKIWHGAVARRQYKNTVRMLCKPYAGLGDKVLAYVIKPMTSCIMAASMAHEVFPDASQLFIYREPVTLAISFRRIGQVLDTMKVIFYLPNLPQGVGIWMRLCGYPNNDYRGWTCAVHPELELGYRCACISLYHYLAALKQGINIRGIRYEDLIAKSDKLIGELLEICHLPASLVDKAKTALDRDSQKDSPIARAVIQQAIPNPPKATPQFMEIARALAKEFGVPGPEEFVDKSFHLPNSIEIN